MKMRLFLSVILLIFPVAGCAGFKSDAPPQTVYSLRPAERSDIDAANYMARIIEIPKPSLPPGFDTDRIALYMEDGHTLDYYASAAWPAPLDDVIQDFTRRTATNVLPYVVTVTPSQSLNADFALYTKVNEFQPVYQGAAGAPPLLLTEVEFTLISLPEGRIVSSFSLARRGIATSNNLNVITAGLQKMLQEVQGEAFMKIQTYLSKTKP